MMKKVLLTGIIGLVVLMLAASISMAAQGRITIDLSDMSTRDALAALFDKAGVNYVLKDGITGRIEKLSFKDVDFQTALDAIIKTSEDLEYVFEDGVYTVGPKQTERKAEAAAETLRKAEPAKMETAESAETGQPSETTGQPETPAQPEVIPYEYPYPYMAPPPPFIAGGVINDLYSGPFGYVPFQYGGVIYGPPPGYITPPYSFGLYSNMPMQPPRFWAPWRGPSPRLNGVPIF